MNRGAVTSRLPMIGTQICSQQTTQHHQIDNKSTCTAQKQHRTNHHLKIRPTPIRYDKNHRQKGDVRRAPESQKASDSRTRILYIGIVLNIEKFILINHNPEIRLAIKTQPWTTSQPWQTASLSTNSNLQRQENGRQTSKNKRNRKLQTQKKQVAM